MMGVNFLFYGGNEGGSFSPLLNYHNKKPCVSYAGGNIWWEGKTHCENVNLMQRRSPPERPFVSWIWAGGLSGGKAKQDWVSDESIILDIQTNQLGFQMIPEGDWCSRWISSLFDKKIVNVGHLYVGGGMNASFLEMKKKIRPQKNQNTKEMCDL